MTTPSFCPFRRRDCDNPWELYQPLALLTSEQIAPLLKILLSQEPHMIITKSDKATIFTLVLKASVYC
jgi:hypothetical protein